MGSIAKLLEFLETFGVHFRELLSGVVRDFEELFSLSAAEESGLDFRELRLRI